MKAFLCLVVATLAVMTGWAEGGNSVCVTSRIDLAESLAQDSVLFRKVQVYQMTGTSSPPEQFCIAFRSIKTKPGRGPSAEVFEGCEIERTVKLQDRTVFKTLEPREGIPCSLLMKR